MTSELSELVTKPCQLADFNNYIPNSTTLQVDRQGASNFAGQQVEVHGWP